MKGPWCRCMSAPQDGGHFHGCSAGRRVANPHSSHFPYIFGAGEGGQAVVTFSKFCGHKQPLSESCHVCEGQSISTPCLRPINQPIRCGLAGSEWLRRVSTICESADDALRVATALSLLGHNSETKAYNVFIFFNCTL